MTAVKNKRHYSTDPEYLKMLAAECDFMGREYDLDIAGGVLTVLALPRKHKKSPKTKEDRDKRKEKFERRDR